MSELRTYLDYNATAPLRRGARVAMVSALALEGNASSVHAEGRRARAVIEHARDQVKALVSSHDCDVAFVGGGTEANNWVLRAGWDTIFVCGIEHDSVLAPARVAARGGGAQIIDIPVNGDGVADVAAVMAMLATGGDFGRTLISLQLANNETGVLQPLGLLGAAAQEFGVAIHCDGVQGAGRVPIDFATMGIDYLTLSAHKIGGPKGVGALIVRDGAEIDPMMVGGGQEKGRRAGTENVAAIAGFGEAAEAAVHDLASISRIRGLRDGLEQAILRITPQAVVIGAGVDRLPNTICVACPGQAAETLVIKLDLQGIAVSAGAACSSGKVGPSHVLAAMGIADDLKRSAIRISLGWGSSDDDAEIFLAAWEKIARLDRAA